MTTYSLGVYALGLFGFTLVKVLAPAYFARQDMRTPVRVGVIAMISNIVLNLIWIPTYGATAAAINTLISYVVFLGSLAVAGWYTTELGRAPAEAAKAAAVEAVQK